MKNEDIKKLFEEHFTRCNEHKRLLIKIGDKVTANSKDIACMKTERKALIFGAGILSVICTYIMDLFLRRS